MNRKILRPLYSGEYEHPFDREALKRLERTRGLELLTNRLLDYGLEKYLRIKHTGDNIRITNNNIPELYGILLEACKLLDVRQVPELYIQLEDKIQSFTSGEKKRVIVISSGAVDLLSRPELLFLMGRELGHIKSNHVFYRMMADSLQIVSQLISDVTLGLGNLLSMPIQVALMYWYRMSEFTADRAGLLACQDPEIAGEAFIKIAGLPQKYHGRVTVKDLRDQAKDFEDLQESNFDKLIRFAAGYEDPQPFTIIRAAELFKWVQRGDYDNIIENKAAKIQSEMANCWNCESPYTKDEKYCRQCGVELAKPKKGKDI
ncbi:MAG: M48 family metallopeptidase [Bacteroidota bacterium]